MRPLATLAHVLSGARRNQQLRSEETEEPEDADLSVNDEGDDNEDGAGEDDGSEAAEVDENGRHRRQPEEVYEPVQTEVDLYKTKVRACMELARA